MPKENESIYGTPPIVSYDDEQLIPYKPEPEPSPMQRQIDELTIRLNELEKELNDLRRATWPSVLANMPIGGTYNHD